ncbi:NBR1-Ig-like domain-containing protein [Amycolatopsis sp. WGS_07]|uniref:NBR1-Ig-like domain-containing protein n=1 Tax=Amycolatopsis sp. WGS_07 TaxID=3076764 RepID=UPI0038730D88
MSEPAAGQPRARRGRRHIVPDAGAGPVARFARALLDLKREAGDPSYDRMRTELGAAASKSALSAATRGRSAPSWPTTWEFVRSLAVTSLGRDEESVRREWRERWEEAVEGTADPETSSSPVGAARGSESLPEERRSSASPVGDVAGSESLPEERQSSPGPVGAARGSESLPEERRSSASPVGDAPGPEPLPKDQPSPSEPLGSAAGPTGEPAPSSRETPADSPAQPMSAEAFRPASGEPVKTRRWGSIAVAATVLVVLGLVAAVVVLATPSSREKDAAAPHYPLPGDSSGFGGDGLSGDVTFPDGAKARYGQTFTKIWRLKNTGSVPWRSRYLQVAGGTTVLCPSPPRVPVPDAEPGQLVEVSVPVTPTGTGVCHVLWKMVDERGALVFPDRTGIFYQVVVTVE